MYSTRLARGAHQQALALRRYMSKPSFERPKRIHRSDTDLLRALSATIDVDPTSYGHEFIDDPFCLPKNDNVREMYRAAFRNGERAAEIVFRQMPELFTMGESVPRIDAFHPPDTNSDLEDSLLTSIYTRDVEKALRSLDEVDITESGLSDEILTDLFTLLAYHGNVPPDPILESIRKISSIDEAKRMKPSEEVMRVVADEANQTPRPPYFDYNCPAMKVFDSIKEKTPRSYEVLIRAFVKHGMFEDAYKVYKSQLKEGMKFQVGVYNTMLNSWGSSSKGDFAGFVMGILNDMKLNKVAPSQETFSSILRKLPDIKCVEDLMFPLMNEMEYLGMKPSLAIYGHLLRLCLFIRKIQRSSEVRLKITIPNRLLERIVLDALNDFVKEPPELVTLDDLDFLPNAMISASNIGNGRLAAQVMDFANKNPHLLPESSSSFFYELYLKALARLGDKELFMKEFKRVVPFKSTPNRFFFFKDLFPSLMALHAAGVIPHVWRVLKNSELAYTNQTIVSEFCFLIGQLIASSSAEEQEQLIEVCDEVIRVLDGVQVFKETSRSARRSTSIALDSKILFSLVHAYIVMDDLQKATRLFLTGVQKIGSLKREVFCDLLDALRSNSEEATQLCVQCIRLTPPNAPYFIEQFRSRFDDSTEESAEQISRLHAVAEPSKIAEN